MLFVNPEPERALLLDAQHADPADDRLHRRRRQRSSTSPTCSRTSERSHCSARPVRFALEMRQGWFAKRGIKAGFKLRGAPFAG
jgi:hypothetical protein